MVSIVFFISTVCTVCMSLMISIRGDHRVVSHCHKNRKSYELHSVSKNQAKLFLSYLPQISTDSDNFWQNDGKQSKNYMRCTHFPPHLTHINALPCKDNTVDKAYRKGNIELIDISQASRLTCERCA